MPAPRKSLAHLKTIGSIDRNPKLFRGRTEPKVIPLGEPSPHLNAHGKMAWHSFKAEIPWLAESDRSILEIACYVRGKLMAGDDVGANYLTLFRQTLSALGATPADRSRIMTVEEQPEDPLDSFFHA